MNTFFVVAGIWILSGASITAGALTVLLPSNGHEYYKRFAESDEEVQAGCRRHSR
jgi:hypothetical protein